MPTKRLDWVTEPSLESLKTTPLIHPSPEVLAHPVEKRGLVEVPLDYSRPQGPKLKIFYRFMPVVGGTAGDPSQPVVVVINGGPGMASRGYRQYDFDYSGKVAPKADYLGELTKYFQVLIMDQRGTAGNSSALDLEDPRLPAEVVVRYFDSLHIALDQQEVINAVLPPDKFPRFSMIAQSFGGLVGMRYISTPAIRRLPQHICFSSAAMPHSDPVKSMLLRRRKQLELNQMVAKTQPQIRERILAFRAYLQKMGLDQNYSHLLWRFLGQGPDGIWERKMAEELDQLLEKDLPSLRAWIGEESEGNFLNYLLSPGAGAPGYSDLTLATETSKQVPFEAEWMPDENWMLCRIGRDGSWREKMIQQVDENPPFGTPFATVEEIREGLSRTRALFSLADGDIYLPLEFVRETASPFYIEGVTREVVLPGGHKALFLPQGARTFHRWTQETR